MDGIPPGTNHHAAVRRVAKQTQDAADTAAEWQTAKRPDSPKRVMKTEMPAKTLHQSRQNELRTPHRPMRHGRDSRAARDSLSGAPLSRQPFRDHGCTGADTRQTDDPKPATPSNAR